MDTSFNKPYGGDVAYMGCQRVIANRRGPEITEGRGNLSFTTINLPRLAIKSERNIDTFYRLLDDLAGSCTRSALSSLSSAGKS